VNIGIVCPYDFTSAGGVQTHIREFSRTLLEQDHQVRVIAPSPESDLVLSLGRCRKVRFSGTEFEIAWADKTQYANFKERLKEERFDLIHLHTPWNPVLPVQVMAASSVPMVATFHDTAPETLLGRVLTKTVMPLAAAALSRYLRAVIAVSPIQQAHLPRGTVVIPNGIERESFNPKKVEPLTQYMDGKVTLLYLGRLEERKGVAVLLEAFSLLQSRGVEAKLLIAGDGHLRKTLEQRGVPGVVFLGRVDEETKRRLYRTCDIFCSPALGGESFGIVLVEAMAAGKPAVGAANRGYRTVLTDEGAELLVPPGDARALAFKLGQLIENPARRHRLGQWGYGRAQRYDWKRVASEVVEIYRREIPLQ